ncbi:hypothetical protein PG984_016171 [Apiospora sp. TS-2023a]
MENMTAYSAAHLAVDYGFVGEDPRQSYWTYRNSQSWLLLDPSTNEAAQTYLRKVLLSATFSQQIQSPSLDLGAKVISDPFTRTPLEIIHMIVTTTDMDVADILNLSKASWAVHIRIRDDQMLWNKILATCILPFYYELDDLEKNENLSRRHNPRDICLWAHCSTSPEMGSQTPLPGVTNRRRIWKVCLQLKELHHKYEVFRPIVTLPQILPPKFRSDSLVCGHEYQVAWPLPQSNGKAPWEVQELVYRELLPCWEAIASGAHMIKAEWHLDGTLANICVTPSPLGTESNSFPQADAAEIPQGDWIRQFILHIPDVEIDRPNACFYPLLPRGLTVILKSGSELMFGETGHSHNLRPLVASRETATIIGLTCKVGLVYGRDRAVYYSVVDALPPSHDHDIDEIIPAPNAQNEPKPKFAEMEVDRLARYLWKADYKELLGGIRIWNFPGLYLCLADKLIRPFDLRWESKEDNAQPIAFEALIWATSADDFRRVKRLSAWMPRGLRPLALRLETEGDGAGNTGSTQIIGTPHGNAGWRYKIDLDGAGGEFVTEIAIRHGSTLMDKQDCDAIRITTNFRQVTWGKKRSSDSWGQVIRAAAGDRLVGLAATFGSPGWKHIMKGLDSMAGLSMAI